VQTYEESGAGFPLLLALLVLAIAMLASALLGVSIEALAYRPVRSAPRLTPLITAIGVSLFLQNAAMLLFTPNPRRYPAILSEVRFELGGVILTNIKVAIFVVAMLLMAGLYLLVHRTWTGRAMRALSMNIDAARLMGINVDQTIRATFAIGSSLAAAGGILYGLDQIMINPLMGVLTGLKAFVAAVLGGIGNIPGALIGGILIGLAEQLTAGYISPDYRDAITFVILILVLLLKPEGLLGVVRQEKV
jgi:branched-chain amino acid transport system permease protein